MIRSLFVSLVATTTLAAGSAFAQDGPPPASAAADNGIAEIVVTAQKRSENLQSTPIAISALTATTMTKMGITNLSGVASVTPTIYSAPYPNSSSTLSYYIRGQGANDPMMITKEGAVGIYIDGVYVSRPQTSNVDLADVERIEVLRGPQGTLYGRNTTGGAVSVISKKPTGELGVRGTFDLGNRDHIRGLVNVDLPAIGNLAIKVSGLYSHDDGYQKNPGPGSHNFQYDKQLAGRVAARWTPTDNLTVDYSFDIGKILNTPVLYVNPDLVGVLPGYTGDKYKAYRHFDLPLSHTNFDDHTLNVEWKLSDDLSLRSITGYRHLGFITHQNFADAYGYGLTGIEDIHSREVTQEFQAVGNLGDHITYVAGLYYFREKASHYQQVGINFSPDLTINDYRFVRALSTSEAAYGQVTWTPPVLNDRVKLTVGGRYTKDKRNSTREYLDQQYITPAGTSLIPLDTGTTNHQRFSRFNPSVTLSFQPTQTLNLYAKVATGYKAGGAAEGSPNFAITFGPEKITSYELGLKSDLLDRKLRVNLAAFTSSYKGIQLDQSLDPNDPSVTETINAGSAKISGIEAELTARPVRDLTLGVSYAYLHTNISRVNAAPGTIFDPSVNPTSPYQVGDNVADLFAIPFAPKNAYTVTADWTFYHFGDGGDLSANLVYRWKDSVFIGSAAGPAVVGHERNVIPSFGQLDGRITLAKEWNGHPFTLALWGRNLTDSHHILQTNGVGGVLAGFTTQTTTYAEPISYGIELGFDF